MFTWEEAGLLRNMLQVLKWTCVALLVIAAVTCRQSLATAAAGTCHGIAEWLHAHRVAGLPSTAAQSR